MINPNEYKISNKLINILSIYCFTQPNEIKTLMEIIEQNKFEEDGELSKDFHKSLIYLNTGFSKCEYFIAINIILSSGVKFKSSKI